MATHGHAVMKQLSPYLSECRKEDGRESKAKAAEGDQGPSWACGGRAHSPAVRAPSRRAGRGPLPNTMLAGSQLTCRQLDSGWNPFAVGNRRRHTTFKRQLSPPGPPPSKRELCSVDSGCPGPGRNGAAGPQDRRAPGPERATGRFPRGAAGPPARPSHRTRPASPKHAWRHPRARPGQRSVQIFCPSEKLGRFLIIEFRQFVTDSDRHVLFLSAAYVCVPTLPLGERVFPALLGGSRGNARASGSQPAAGVNMGTAARTRVCVHTLTHAHAHTETHAQKHAGTCMCPACAPTHTRTHTHTSTYTRVPPQAHVQTHRYTRAQARIHMHTHTCTHTHTCAWAHAHAQAHTDCRAHVDTPSRARRPTGLCPHRSKGLWPRGPGPAGERGPRRSPGRVRTGKQGASVPAEVPFWRTSVSLAAGRWAPAACGRA